MSIILLLLALATPGDIEGLVADLSDPTRRIAALNELRNRKDPAAIPLLVEAIRGSSDDWTVYYGVLVLDSYAPADAKRIWPGLIRAGHPFARLASATALYRAGERDAVPVIARTLGEAGISSQLLSWMLNRLYGIDEPPVADAVRARILPGGDPVVLGSALSYLNQTRPENSMAAVAGLLEDPRPGIRALAGAFLYRHGETERAGALAAALREEGLTYSDYFRVQQFLMQAPHLSEEILEATADLARSSKEPLCVQMAVELLAKARYRKAIPLFRELIEHENEQVAKAAFDALAELSGSVDPETLRPLLAAKAPARRLWAAEALRRMDDRSGLEVAIAILQEGETKDRVEAARVLGGFRVAAAVDALLPGIESPDQSLRYAAYNSLSQVLTALFPYRRLDLASTGYQVASPPAANAAAVARIREWWGEHRAGGW